VETLVIEVISLTRPRYVCVVLVGVFAYEEIDALLGLHDEQKNSMVAS